MAKKSVTKKDTKTDKKTVSKKPSSQMAVKKKVARKKTASKKPAAKKSATKKTVTKKVKTIAAAAIKVNDPKSNIKSGTVKLEASLTISNAADLKAQLSPYLEGYSEIIIDAAALEVIDTACLQVLISFISNFRDNSVNIIWNNVPEVMNDTANLLGLNQHLGL